MEESLRQQLAELEQKYRSVMDSTTEAILIVSPIGQIIETNTAAQRLLGYTSEEFVKMHISKLYPEKEAKRVMAFFNEVLERKSGSLDDALLLAKDGRVVSIAITSSVVEWVGKKVVMGFIYDITERKQENALLYRFAHFSELNPNPIVELDMMGRICYINPVANRLFPDIQDAGTKHPFLTDTEEIINMFMRNEKEFLIREIKIGNICYQQSIYCIPEKQFIHIYGLDITELKKAEEEVLQSEKLSALGKFSAGIAHEVRNPLGVILGGVEFLEKRLSKAEKDIVITITKVKDSTLRATDILQKLLTFSKPTEIKIEKAELKHLIEESITLLKYSFAFKSVVIETNFVKEDIYIAVDKNQFQQVLFNILINASEAMPSGGKIYVKLYKLSVTSLNKPAAVTEITDTGTGISKEDLTKIFEPFFTTKGKRGTGLGLTTARMIIKNYQGDITIHSEIGKGTTIKIVLPLIQV